MGQSTVRRRSQSVGWITPSDVDANQKYVRELRDKLAPLVAKCFAADAKQMAEWNELNGRVDKLLRGGSSWLYAPMELMAGRVIAAQLDAWVPRVKDAGCPIDAPPDPPPPAVPGWGTSTITVPDINAALTRPVIVILALAWLSRKLL